MGEPDPGSEAPDPAAILERLRGVIDPELGVGIVDLGLVYGVQVCGPVVRVRMTTTTPACPIGEYLAGAVRQAVVEGGGVLGVDVQLTHEPRWSPDAMSKAAKARLGWR